MKTWRSVARAIGYVKWWWLGNLIGITVIFLAFQLPGLVNREFFDLITGDAPARIDEYGRLAEPDGGRRAVSLGILVFTARADRDDAQLLEEEGIDRSDDLGDLGGSPQHPRADPREREDSETEADEEKLSIHGRAPSKCRR